MACGIKFYLRSSLLWFVNSYLAALELEADVVKICLKWFVQLH
jgi:hypothetical protein